MIDQTFVSCVACKSRINSGAEVCPICKSYQVRWKRNLYYCATMAGIVTVVISLLTYVASTWPEIRRTLFWRDVIEITAFDSKNSIIIHNSGDGRVFVSYLALRSKELGHSSVIFINKTIESKSFLVHDLKTSTSNLNEWGTGNFADDFWQRTILKQRLVDNESIQWHFYCLDDPAYQTMKTFLGNGFRAVSIDATIYFHSGRDGHRIGRDLRVSAVPFVKRTDVSQPRLISPLLDFK